MSDGVRISPDEMRLIVQEASEQLACILATAPKATLEELARLLDEGSEDS